MATPDPYFELLTSAIRNPSRYKLCEVCGNIVELEAEECIFCSAYRFECDPEHVSNAALDQATHPRTSVTTSAPLSDD